MKEITNYHKLEKIIESNKGYITREDVDKNNIPSWFLSDFVKRKGLIRIAPGFYANKAYTVDDYYILQKRYPKYIFSGMSALYLLSLTDKIVTDLEVVAPHGYNPSRDKNNKLIIRRISDPIKYSLGVVTIKTMFGNSVQTYDPERTICDLVKYREDYDAETFVKALRFYIKKYNNQIKLMQYAKMLSVEKKVFEVMELISNDI